MQIMASALLIFTLFLLSVVTSFPLDSSPTSATPEIRTGHSSGGHQNEETKDMDMDKEEEKITSALPGSGAHQNDKAKDADKEEEKITSTLPKEDSQREICNKTINMTVTFVMHRITKSGERKKFNKTLVRKATTCCEGYEMVGGLCKTTMCRGKTCNDPNSKCVTVERCEQLLPIFVTKTGIISTTCTQPEETQAHLNHCGNTTTVCETSSHCGNFERREAVCFNTKCDCTPGRTWLKVSGNYADCIE